MTVWLLLLVACGSYGLEPMMSDDGGTLKTDPAWELAFGKRATTAGTVSEPITLISSGESPLTVQDVWLESEESGIFDLGELPFPRTLEAGEEMPVNVLFTPERAERYTGTLYIEIGDGGRVAERNLVGAGCNPRDC
jgi:hypothetical protein